MTYHGLGEAARRVKSGQKAGVFSFLGGDKIDCSRDPLVVQHGLKEDPYGAVAIANEWKPDQLESRCRAALPRLVTWAELIARCRLLFGNLLLPDSVLQRLGVETFHSNVAERTIELLGTLDAYMTDRHVGGTEGTRARELRQQHFVGDKAWFTDESASNKLNFKTEMTFIDPENQTRRIFCPFHGKIKSPQFRIHFEWPVPVNQNKLKVLYIGPKIAKR